MNDPTPLKTPIVHLRRIELIFRRNTQVLSFREDFCEGSVSLEMDNLRGDTDNSTRKAYRYFLKYLITWISLLFY